MGPRARPTAQSVQGWAGTCSEGSCTERPDWTRQEGSLWPRQTAGDVKVAPGRPGLRPDTGAGLWGPHVVRSHSRKRAGVLICSHNSRKKGKGLTHYLPAEGQDCSLCDRENVGVALSGGSPETREEACGQSNTDQGISPPSGALHPTGNSPLAPFSQVAAKMAQKVDDAHASPAGRPTGHGHVGRATSSLHGGPPEAGL